MVSEVIKTGTDATFTSTTDSRGFLGDLTHPTSPIPKYTYQGKEQFLKDFKHALNTMQPYSEWLLLTSVTNEIFHADFLESEEHPFSNVSSYNKQLETLLLRMDVSKPHEAAVHEFGLLLHNAASRHRVSSGPTEAITQRQTGARLPTRRGAHLNCPQTDHLTGLVSCSKSASLKQEKSSCPTFAIG